MNSLKNNDQSGFYDKEFKTIAPFWIENNIRNFYFQNLIEIILKNGNLKSSIDALEIGCGKGLLMEKMQKQFPDWRITGMDISEKEISTAKLKGLNVMVADIENFDPAKNKYDLIYGTAILHHLTNLKPFLENIGDLLNNNGIFLIGAEPSKYNFVYILSHIIRGTWKVEKGQLNINSNEINKYLSRQFTNIHIYTIGNAFAYSFINIGKTWNITHLANFPFINDYYIYSEKRK